MSLIGKIFGKRKEQSDSIEAKPPMPNNSEARNEYFEDLKAQLSSRQETILFDDADSMTQDERMFIAKKLVTVKPKTTIKVVEEGSAEDNGDLVVAEDGFPAGKVFGGDDGKYADVWTTFAMINPRILKHFVSRAFIGYPACTILGTHEIINPCCAMPGEDAMSPGYTLICMSGEHKQNDKHIMMEEMWLDKMRSRARSMGLEKNCTDLAFYTRLYGIGVAIPRVELKDGHTFDEPFDPSFIKEGSFRGFSIVDPQRFSWDLTTDTLYNPLSEYYMRPEYLRLFNNEDTHIHRTWCIVCYFKEVGDDLKGTYMWGGVPLSQMLYERVFCADKLANEIVALAMSKRTVVKDGNLKAMIADPHNTNNFIKRWNGYRNNQAIAFKEPGEQIQQLETSLADLQPLSAQQYQYAAAIAGIPVTKLLKNVPSGLQATGQYEQDEYEQTLVGIQERIFRPLMDKFFVIDIASNYPDREDLQVEVQFNPIHTPKAAEIQQMASQRAGLVSGLLQQNAITITEARAILKVGESPIFDILSSDTPEALLKIEKLRDPEEQQKLQMQMQQQMMMGGMGGAGGMPGMGGMQGNPADGGAPTATPQFQENKGVFEQALNEVMGEGEGEGESEGGGEGEGEGEGEGRGAEQGQEQENEKKPQ